MNLSLVHCAQFVLMLPITLLVSLFMASCSSEGDSDGRRRSEGAKQSYSTNFSATENPISEGGKWINGGTTGRDWGNVQSTPGLAFGTNVSSAPPYDDSTAVLAGTWGPNQMAQATVFTVSQTPAIGEEVELRLRTTITAHR